MSTFNPLNQLRAVMDDESLTASQRLVLCAAITRTDNCTSRVRCSQELLAETAHVSASTVERALRHPAVRRYFTRERDGRRLNLTWLVTPVSVTSTPVTVTGYTRQPDGPSTSYLPSTSTRTGATQEDYPLASSDCPEVDGEFFFEVAMEQWNRDYGERMLKMTEAEQDAAWALRPDLHEKPPF